MRPSAKMMKPLRLTRGSPAEPRGVQQTSYCMMLAPPPGPAHSIELRLTHGLCAGAGHVPHHAPPPQQPHALAPLHGLDHDMSNIFDPEYVRLRLRVAVFNSGCFGSRASRATHHH